MMSVVQRTVPIGSHDDFGQVFPIIMPAGCRMIDVFGKMFPAVVPTFHAFYSHEGQYCQGHFRWTFSLTFSWTEAVPGTTLGIATTQILWQGK